MASPVTPPRGMRDILPAEKVRRERMLSTIRQVYRAHGFDEIETPVMEDSSRLHAGLGGDNEKLAFAVMKRGLGAEDFAAATTALDLADLGLRFDLTVPLARFYASHRAELPSVFRSIQIAPVWRAERPQKGRYRQFMQCDIDIIGEPGIMAEVELITATTAALDALGIPGCSIRLNDRRLLTAWLTDHGVPESLQPRALITMDKLDKIGLDGVVAELGALGVENAGALFAWIDPSASIDESWTMLANSPLAAHDAVRELLAIRDALPGIALQFDPFLVRGMGYYTGPIFEVAHPELGYSLGGGGRYDGMIGRFSGGDVPASGFSLGFERLVDLVDLDGSADDGGSAILYDGDVEPVALVGLARSLIAEGHRVRLVRRPKNVKSALDQLASEGFSRFASVSAAVVASGSSAPDATLLPWRTLGPAPEDGSARD